MKNKNYRKLNNSGSALIVSIIVLLFVSILATVILYMAGVNYRMKKNELKTKVVFYSGEVYLERMQCNLIIPVSEAMDHAYRMTNSRYYSLANSDDRRQDFYDNFDLELKDLLVKCYGETDTITNGTGGTIPSDSMLIKNIIHNLTSSGPDSTDGIPIDHIYCNDNTISGVPYQHYDNATDFIDKILEFHPDYFAGDADPEHAVYYVVVYGQLNQGGADADAKRDNNYKEFVTLDVTNPATGNLAEPEKCRLLFKNVCVVCVQNGFTSIISTDLAVQFPPIDWDNGTSSDTTTFWNMFQLFYYVNWKNN